MSVIRSTRLVEFGLAGSLHLLVKCFRPQSSLLSYAFLTSTLFEDHNRLPLNVATLSCVERKYEKKRSSLIQSVVPVNIIFVLGSWRRVVNLHPLIFQLVLCSSTNVVPTFSQRRRNFWLTNSYALAVQQSWGYCAEVLRH